MLAESIIWRQIQISLMSAPSYMPNFSSFGGRGVKGDRGIEGGPGNDDSGEERIVSFKFKYPANNTFCQHFCRYYYSKIPPIPWTSCNFFMLGPTKIFIKYET